MTKRTGDLYCSGCGDYAGDHINDRDAAQQAEINRLREALTQIASGNVFETAFPTAELITAPELEDGYLVASEFARAALQVGIADMEAALQLKDANNDC